MSDRAGRVAQNEVLFREVNERIREFENGAGQIPPDAPLQVVCECSNIECTDHIELTSSQYENIRVNPTHFVVLPGHENPEIAKVIERNDNFLVEAKLGEAAKVAIEHDPRSVSG